MSKTIAQNFRCMMCGHEYTESVPADEDKERSCPKCRSNSIRHLKAGAVVAGTATGSARNDGHRR